MLFDGSSIPIVGWIEVDRDIEFSGDKGNGGNGHIVFLAWEASVDLEILEQEGEAQPVGSLLVFKERQLIGLESPVRHQVVVRPKPFHTASSLIRPRKQRAGLRGRQPTSRRVYGETAAVA